MLEPAGLRFRCHKNGRNCPLEIVYLESTWKGVSIESMYLESSCFFPLFRRRSILFPPSFGQAWSRECESQRVPKVRLGRIFKGGAWMTRAQGRRIQAGFLDLDHPILGWRVNPVISQVLLGERWTVNCSLLSDVYQYGKGLITALCIGDHRGFWCWTHDVGLSWFVQI